MAQTSSQKAACERAARACIQFIQTCCVHTIGRWAGQPFILSPWELEFVIAVFGLVDEYGMRVVRTALLFIARKNGKSELAAAIALYLLIADGEQAPQIYGAAKDADQAKLVFDVAADMVRLSEHLQNVCEIKDSIKRINCPANRGYYRAIPADAAGAHGFNAHGVILDEFHTQPNRELWDVLRTSMLAREQPLTLGITTAGIGRSGVCYDQYDYARRLLAGEVDDPSTVARIFEVPEGTTFATLAAQDADGNFIHEDDLWSLANPSLLGQPGGFLDPEKIRVVVREALEIPSLQNSVLQLHFNLWVGAESHWIPPDVWAACNLAPIDEDALAGRDCFAGIDVATTQDFTSYALVFPWGEEQGLGFDVLVRTFLPEGTAAGRTKQRHELAAWVAAGELELTPGSSNEFAYFRDRLLADAEQFHIREVGFDPFLMRESATILENEGLTLVEVRQGPRTMTSPIQQVELLALKHRLNHGGNRLLAWQIGNVKLKNAEGGMVMLSKDKAKDKIDSVSALCTAIERAIHQRKTRFSGVVT